MLPINWRIGNAGGGGTVGDIFALSLAIPLAMTRTIDFTGVRRTLDASWAREEFLRPQNRAGPGARVSPSQNSGMIW